MEERKKKVVKIHLLKNNLYKICTEETLTVSSVLFVIVAIFNEKLYLLAE